MTDYPFEMGLVVDPDNPANISAGGSVAIYAPDDLAGNTLLPLKDANGFGLANPLTSNANGYIPAFVAPHPQVRWQSGDFSGFFNSFTGLRNEAVAAKNAAETSAAAAEAAVELAQAPTDEQVDAGISRANIPGQVGAVVPGLVNAQVPPLVGPLVADAVANDPTVISSAANMAQSTVGLVPVWKANTVYTAGQKVIAPDGDVVSAKVNFTSAATYNAANWNPSPNGSTLATMFGRELPDRGRATVATHGSVDNMTANGIYQVTLSTDASGLGLPSPNASEVKVYNVGTIVHQVQTVLGASWQTLYRRRAGGVFSTWVDPLATVNNALSNRIAPFEATTKAYVAQSRSAGTAYFLNGPLAITQRQPFRTGGNCKSFRQWFQNYDERSNTPYTGQCDITGVWVGKAALDSFGIPTGQFASAPVQVSGAITGPTDGSPFCTSLIFPATIAIDPTAMYISSYGVVTATGIQHRTQGISWSTASTANAGQTTTTATLTRSNFSALNSWIEVNTTSSIVAQVGDSHVACGAADMAVYDSVINKFCFANGMVPVNMGAGGSTFAEWSNIAERRWQRYLTNNVKPDAWILSLGQNDIYNAGLTFEALKEGFYAVAAIGRQVLGPNMYLTTVKPRNGEFQTPAQNAVRIQFNDWLRTLPGGAVGLFDLAAAVTDATGDNLDLRYVTGDKVHAPTAGTDAEAKSINQRIGSKNV